MEYLYSQCGEYQFSRFFLSSYRVKGWSNVEVSLLGDGKSPRDTRVVIFIVTLKPSLRSIKHRVSNAFPPFRPLFPSFLRTRSLDYRFRSLCTSRLQENGFLSRNILRPNVTSIRKLFIFLYNFLYRDEFNPNIISYFIYIYLFIFQTTFKRLYITRI